MGLGRGSRGHLSEEAGILTRFARIKAEPMELEEKYEGLKKKEKIE